MRRKFRNGRKTTQQSRTNKIKRTISSKFGWLRRLQQKMSAYNTHVLDYYICSARNSTILMSFVYIRSRQKHRTCKCERYIYAAVFVQMLHEKYSTPVSTRVYLMFNKITLIQFYLHLGACVYLNVDSDQDQANAAIITGWDWMNNISTYVIFHCAAGTLLLLLEMIVWRYTWK